MASQLKQPHTQQSAAIYVPVKPLVEIQNRELKKAGMIAQIQARIAAKKEKEAQAAKEAAMRAQLNGTFLEDDDNENASSNKSPQQKRRRKRPGPSPTPKICDFIPKTQLQKTVKYGYDYRMQGALWV